jgi:hypothetical protein
MNCGLGVCAVLRGRIDRLLWALAIALMVTLSFVLWKSSLRGAAASEVNSRQPLSRPKQPALAETRMPRVTDCGPRSLYVLLKMAPATRSITYTQVRSRFQSAGNGNGIANAQEIVEVAGSFGLKGKVAELTYEGLCSWLEVPGNSAILHCIEGRHFAPAVGAQNGQVVMCDPGIGLDIVDASALVGGQYRWGTVAILFGDSPK